MHDPIEGGERQRGKDCSNIERKEGPYEMRVTGGLPAAEVKSLTYIKSTDPSEDINIRT